MDDNEIKQHLEPWWALPRGVPLPHDPNLDRVSYECALREAKAMSLHLRLEIDAYIRVTEERSDNPQYGRVLRDVVEKLLDLHNFVVQARRNVEST